MISTNLRQLSLQFSIQGFESGTWDLIVLASDLSLSFSFLFTLQYDSFVSENFIAYVLAHKSKLKFSFQCHCQHTVIILNIGTDRSEQTVQTQIRLLLMEQSDQGLLCLLFCLHLLNTILNCKIKLFQL